MDEFQQDRAEINAQQAEQDAERAAETVTVTVTELEELRSAVNQANGQVGRVNAHVARASLDKINDSLTHLIRRAADAHAFDRDNEMFGPQT